MILLNLFQEYHLWSKTILPPRAYVDRILKMKKQISYKLKFYISVIDERYAYLNWEPVVDEYDIGEL